MDDRPHHSDKVMENQTPFDLNDSIQRWKTTLASAPSLRPEDLAELESHLRESTRQLQADGLNEEEAFLIAVRRLGNERELAREFAKLTPRCEIIGRPEPCASLGETGPVMDLGRCLKTVVGLSLLWTLIWGALGAGVSLLIGLIDPPSIDPGEGPWDLAWIVGMAGLLAGAVFGVILLVGERRSELAEVWPVRAVMWGVTAGMILPFLLRAEVSTGHLANTVVASALSAVVSIILARRLRLRPAVAVA